MIQRTGNDDLFISLNRKTKYLWHRLTRTDLLGLGAVTTADLNRSLIDKGFDLTKPIERLKDSDSVYYKQER